jgi:hypothetical protein
MQAPEGRISQATGLLRWGHKFKATNADGPLGDRTLPLAHHSAISCATTGPYSAVASRRYARVDRLPRGLFDRSALFRRGIFDRSWVSHLVIWRW